MEISQMKVKLCKDCKHCLTYYPNPKPGCLTWVEDNAASPTKWMCNINVAYDYVTGYTKRLSCYTHRNSISDESVSYCGKDGQYFEKKITSILKKK